MFPKPPKCGGTQNPAPPPYFRALFQLGRAAYGSRGLFLLEITPEALKSSTAGLPWPLLPLNKDEWSRGQRVPEPRRPQDSLSCRALCADGGDRMGKEFLQRLQEVSGCSSQGFSPWLQHAWGREGASMCPPGPSPKSRCTAPCKENEPSGAASAPITSPRGWCPARDLLVEQHEMAAADRSCAQPDPSDTARSYAPTSFLWSL